MLPLNPLKRTDRHLQTVTLVILAGMAVLVGGLWYVQVALGKYYQAHLENQSYRSVRVPSIRGRILDNNGVALADSRPLYNINLYLEEMSRSFQAAYSEDLRRAQSVARRKLDRAERSQLARQSRYQVVSNLVQAVGRVVQVPVALSETEFREHYEKRLPLPLSVAANLTLEQIARFVEHGTQLPGVNLETQAMRVYPGGTLASHILGYLRRDDSSKDDEESFYNYRLLDFRGESGLEALFDPQLRGRAGGKSLLVNNLGYRQAEQIWNPPQPGNNIHLTLDARLQTASERALRSLGENTRGAVVVMDVLNGDVLAAASAPSFDPNELIPRISQETWTRLSDPKLMPQINRVTYGAYPPGSIFKIVVALAGLEAGTIKTNEIVFNRGFYAIGRRNIHDTAAPGDYDFKLAFIKSSNTYFIIQGLRVTPRRLVEMGEQFHLGERTGLLPSQEVPGDFPSIEDVTRRWGDGDTANISIGQGPITVTPIQMAVMTSAVANGGKVYWPRLVRRIEPQDPESGVKAVDFPAGRLRNELTVQPQVMATVREAMLADVEEEGTGKKSFVQGMNVCGKTGTAQIMHGRRTVDYVTWFTSFAPFENPRYAVVVMVESGTSGGGTCAPVAKAVYSEIQKLYYPPVPAPGGKTRVAANF